MPHIPHDLAAVFEVVDGALELAEVRIRKIERDAEDRLHIGTAPLVGEITDRPELVKASALEFFVELAHVRLYRRSLEPQPKFPDSLAEYASEFGIERFKRRHALRTLSVLGAGFYVPGSGFEETYLTGRGVQGNNHVVPDVSPYIIV
jgi:hypothetical protein